VTQFVLDASPVLGWCFPDEYSPQTQRIADLFKQGATAIAPPFWPHEVLSALLVGERRKRITAPLIQAFLDDLSALPITLETFETAHVFDNIHALCRKHALTPYDAAYLDLAIRTGLPLATLDQDLIRASNTIAVALL
jgi:predicted nucleic acid-binding protein